MCVLFVNFLCRAPMLFFAFLVRERVPCEPGRTRFTWSLNCVRQPCISSFSVRPACVRTLAAWALALGQLSALAPSPTVCSRSHQLRSYCSRACSSRPAAAFRRACSDCLLQGMRQSCCRANRPRGLRSCPCRKPPRFPG